jgi:SAM-dependent MidA family methyltransferase
MRPLEHLREHLTTHKRMPFVDFMQAALYSPVFGYYTQANTPIGAQGDFITAPELTPLFGYTVASQCMPVLKYLKHPVIFEFGAGTGRLCIDILTHLEHHNTLPETYQILDVSGALRAVQEKNIHDEIPHLASRVRWVSTLPDTAFEGIILANEVLDAMPVHRFLKTETELLESMITLDEHGELHEIFEPCTNAALINHVTRVLTHDVRPYASEANLHIQSWLNACYALLTRGLVLLIDYGFPEHEYYHPDRSKGTLMCHHQHKAHPNPLQNPGYEDITAHVDFTHVADSALDAGFDVRGYTNQASFLLANGLLSLLEQQSDVKTQQAVKHLVQPNEMGELFKVMALTKALDMPLTGFQWHDKRASLSS